MRILTIGRTTTFATVLMLLTGLSAGAVSLPLPERNPIRETETEDDADFALPERNPMRDAGLALPQRNPARAKPEATAEDQKAKPDPNKWSEEEVAAERARCAKVLEGLAAVTEPDDPVREGMCGAPAPVKLIAIGKDPQVRVSPPSIVTCDMAAAMVRWFERDVQPAARKLLAAPVTRINVVGHYSCRQALGRTTTRLSEHGLANALDIRDFVIEGGQVADLKRDWGPNSRDIAARIAAEQAAEAARKVAAAAAEAAKKAVKEAAPKIAKVASDRTDAKMALGSGVELAKKALAKQTVDTAGTASAAASVRRLSRSEVRRARREARRVDDVSLLGGPAVSAGEGIASPAPASSPGKKSSTAKVPPAPAIKLPVEEEKTSPRREFLRQIHAKACGTFGTVLGPEANEAHRDHFHLDMAKRRYRSFCE